MSRYLINVVSTAARDRALELVRKAPFGSRVEVKAAKRSMPQNDLMWSLLTEVARQVKWHGLRLRPDDWKLIFLDGLKRELRTVPNLDGTGLVNLGRSSSDLTKDEMSNLIELIHMFGANHDIVFADDRTSAQPEPGPLVGQCGGR